MPLGQVDKVISTDGFMLGTSGVIYELIRILDGGRTPSVLDLYIPERSKAK